MHNTQTGTEVSPWELNLESSQIQQDGGGKVRTLSITLTVYPNYYIVELFASSSLSSSPPSSIKIIC